jgi:hypothetical protein
MYDKRTLGNEVSVDEQPIEQNDDVEQSVAPQTVELRASVEQETQGKVDTNHPDAVTDEGMAHLTLEQQERVEAREAELERISTRAELSSQQGRAERSRRVAAEGSVMRRREFQQRAASVDAWKAPDRPDPRAELSREQVATVNEKAQQVAERTEGWTAAAIGRWIAEAVRNGDSVLSATISVNDAVQKEAGTVVPIGKLESIERREVSIEGQIETLWDPSHPGIAQVGLIGDESGRTKFTVWKASDAPWMAEGERVRIHNASKNWYGGRVSVAVTGWSEIHFPERGRWWE